MRKDIRRGVVCIFLFAFAGSLSAQVIESNSQRELNFVFEVKQIDEFFERFNNEQNSLLASYIRLKYPEVQITRTSLLESLFNTEVHGAELDLIREFCLQVADSARPAYLDFYSGEWYAEAVCKFKLNGQLTEAVVLLKIQQEENGGSKWIIVSAFSKRLGVTDLPVIFPYKPGCCKFLNPMSHATNFISLSRAFRDKINLSDYLDTSFLEYPYAKSFARAILRNQLEYLYVKEIRYHFLQIDGWIFTVSQYTRKSIHSGWLVSSLQKATREEKEIYRSSLINRISAGDSTHVRSDR
ncbi:MAG TPA: hypothetical protein VKA49_17605 [Flavitalea sp.]|nr:hypothetical protein [Flavitalea sp.]